MIQWDKAWSCPGQLDVPFSVLPCVDTKIYIRNIFVIQARPLDHIPTLLLKCMFIISTELKMLPCPLASDLMMPSICLYHTLMRVIFSASINFLLLFPVSRYSVFSLSYTTVFDATMTYLIRYAFS